MPIVQPQQTISSLFDQTEPRCLEMFSECVKEANRRGSRKWGVTHYGNDRVRLNVGNIVVCTLHAGRIWFALDKAWSGSPECNFVGQSYDWTWTPKHDYAVVPSMSGLYVPSTAKAHAAMWSRIKKMHFDLIDKAASKYNKLRSSSKKAHSAEFMNYLRRRLNDPTIPDPQ